jgi:hypothetical protein
MINAHEVDLDFGKLHLSANLFGYEFAEFGDGFNSSFHALFELGKSAAVRAHASVPLLFGLANGDGPLRFEAGALFHVTKDTREEESLVLSSRVVGDKLETKSVNVPVDHRTSTGLGAGVIYRNTVVEAQAVGTTRSNHLTAYMGFSLIDARGGNVKVAGYEKGFFDFSWGASGLDFLYDVVQDYDAAPKGKPGKIGARLWSEVIMGNSAGPTARLDLGYMPGGTGLYLVLGIGGGLHLL